MDKAEYRSKLEEINSLAEAGKFREAAVVADEVDWKHVKSARTLCMIGEIYEADKRYIDSAKILRYAYKRSSSSKTVLYRLAELDIRNGEYDEAKRFINEFEQNSPNDTSRYILKYKLLRATKAPLDDQITVLKDYKDHEYTERWAYELAKLYKKNGQKEKCIEECDDMILWFSEGKYVTKAMELKMSITTLTPSQQAAYDNRHLVSEKAVQENEEMEVPQLTGLESVEKKILTSDDDEDENVSTVRGDEAIQRLEQAAVTQVQREESAEVKEEPEELEVPEEPVKEKKSFGAVAGGLQKKLSHSIRAVFSGMRLNDEEDEDEDIKIAPDRSEREVEPTLPEEEVSIENVSDLGHDEVPSFKEIPSGEKSGESDEKGSFDQKNEDSLQEDSLGQEDEDSSRKDSLGQEGEESSRKDSLGQEGEESFQKDSLGQEDKENLDKENPDEGNEENLQEESGELLQEESAEVLQPKFDEVPQTEIDDTEDPAVQAEPSVEEQETVSPAEDEEDQTPAKDESEDALKESLTAGLDLDKLFAETGDALAGEVASGGYVMADTLETDREQAEADALRVRNRAQAIAAENKMKDPSEDLIARETDESLGLTRELHLRDAIEEELSRRSAEAASGVPEASRTPIMRPEEAARKAVAEAHGTAYDPDSVADEDLLDEPLSDLPEGDGVSDEELLAIYGGDEAVRRELLADDSDIPAIPEEESRESLMSLSDAESGESRSIIDSIMGEPGVFTAIPVEGRALTEPEKKALSYFASIPGIDYQVTSALADIHNNCGDKTSKSGNIAIMGRQGSGKTRLAEGLILMTCMHLGIKAAKVGRIVAETFNEKDPAAIVSQMAGGFLIIEAAGALSDASIDKLDQAMEFRTDDMIVILEDEKSDMKQLLDKHPSFASKFTSRITVPVFTNDELVTFARTYAKEEGYKFDEMATLALYTMIGDNQRDTEPMTVGKVRQLVDKAIEKNSRKLFGKTTDKEDGRIVLMEKDFNF